MDGENIGVLRRARSIEWFYHIGLKPPIEKVVLPRIIQGRALPWMILLGWGRSGGFGGVSEMKVPSKSPPKAPSKTPPKSPSEK